MQPSFSLLKAVASAYFQMVTSFDLKMSFQHFEQYAEMSGPLLMRLKIGCAQSFANLNNCGQAVGFNFVL